MHDNSAWHQRHRGFKGQFIWSARQRRPRCRWRSSWHTKGGLLRSTAATVWNSQCKQPPALLPSRVRCQAGERDLRRHLWVLSETAGDPAAGREDEKEVQLMRVSGAAVTNHQRFKCGMEKVTPHNTQEVDSWLYFVVQTEKWSVYFQDIQQM